MKITKFLLPIFICLGLTVQAQKSKNTLTPKTTFDTQAARNALQKGNATIKGVVLLKAENPDNVHLGIKVALFPVTPYLLEFQELVKKNKKTPVSFSKEFFAYRIECKASDKDGSFEFVNLKPGKYFLATQVQHGKLKTKTVRTGRTQTDLYNVFGVKIGGYSTPTYETFSYNEVNTKEFSTFCEITQADQVLNVEL